MDRYFEGYNHLCYKENTGLETRLHSIRVPLSLYDVIYIRFIKQLRQWQLQLIL